MLTCSFDLSVFVDYSGLFELELNLGKYDKSIEGTAERITFFFFFFYIQVLFTADFLIKPNI